MFLVDEAGRRPVFGARALFRHDPNWRDLVPFHEYFHGDTGAGVDGIAVFEQARIVKP